MEKFKKASKLRTTPMHRRNEMTEKQGVSMFVEKNVAWMMNTEESQS